MTRLVSMPRERKRVVRAATLMIEAECVSARDRREGPFMNLERIRRPHPCNREPVNTRPREVRKISFEHILVRRWRVGKTFVHATAKFAIEDFFTGSIDKGEIRRDDVHFAKRAEIITHHRALRKLWAITHLVHVQRGIETQWLGRRGEFFVLRNDTRIRTFN